MYGLLRPVQGKHEEIRGLGRVAHNDTHNVYNPDDGDGLGVRNL
jgi:hypothetical protein